MTAEKYDLLHPNAAITTCTLVGCAGYNEHLRQRFREELARSEHLRWQSKRVSSETPVYKYSAGAGIQNKMEQQTLQNAKPSCNACFAND